MANKVCKRDYFSAIRTVIEANPELHFGTEKFPEMPTADVLAFIDNELSLLNSKSGALKKPTATQQANEVLKTELLAFLDAHADERFTCSNLQKVCPACADLSTPKISAVINQMVGDGLVVKETEKRVSYFKAG
jgi:hypothetical protein